MGSWLGTRVAEFVKVALWLNSVCPARCRFPRHFRHSPQRHRVPSHRRGLSHRCQDYWQVLANRCREAMEIAVRYSDESTHGTKPLIRRALARGNPTDDVRTGGSIDERDVALVRHDGPLGSVSSHTVRWLPKRASSGRTGF